MSHKAKDYWFKRKRYGYGWVPVKRQGWSVVILFVILMLPGMFIIKDTPEDEFSPQVVWYLAYVFSLVAILIIVARAKGPRPKWRWGKKQDDDPEEDY